MLVSTTEKKVNCAFLSGLLCHFRTAGISLHQVEQAFLIFITLVSSKLGKPLFTQVKARWSETVSKIISLVLEVIPEEWYVDTLPMLISGVNQEIFDGKIVVSTSGTGLPFKISGLLHQNYLRGKMGYVGTLHEDDPLQESSSVLVIDMEEGTSGVVAEFDNESNIQSLPIKAQKIIIQNHLRLLAADEFCPDIPFLEKAMQQLEEPEKIPTQRLTTLITKIYTKPFQSNDVSPIKATDQICHRGIYKLSYELLTRSARASKPLTHDMGRRVYEIYLDARLERPWERKGFRYPDIIGWIRKNRGQLVGALLTLIQAWVAAGRLPWSDVVLGSFERWTETVGGILANANYQGFLANLSNTHTRMDSDESNEWRMFLEALLCYKLKNVFTAKEISDVIMSQEINPIRNALPPSFKYSVQNNDDPSSLKIALGIFFQRHQGQQFRYEDALYHLEKSKSLKNGASIWSFHEG
jgi:hypothetical protein